MAVTMAHPLPIQRRERELPPRARGRLIEAHDNWALYRVGPKTLDLHTAPARTPEGRPLWSPPIRIEGHDALGRVLEYLAQEQERSRVLRDRRGTRR